MTRICPTSTRTRASIPGRSGFTLTELMVAIAVLVGVLLASSKIFTTTSTVTRTGKAAQDVLQEAVAIESRLRSDLERLSYEGLFAIRCVEVKNDINGAVLLNPDLAPDAAIRSDQLMFFANGAESAQTYRIGEGEVHKGQGTVSRIYYGHGFQLDESSEPVDTLQRGTDPLDLTDTDFTVKPWTRDSVDTVKTIYEGGVDIFSVGSPQSVDVVPPDARRWVFVRQPVLLIDDDAGAYDGPSKSSYLGDIITALSIFRIDPREDLDFSPQIYHGRVDAAATQLNDIRYAILWDDAAGEFRSFEDQYSLIAKELLYYPRAERRAPSMHRVDQALTNHVLSAACSSVRIEWTWKDRTGAVLGPAGIPIWIGVRTREPLSAGEPEIGDRQQPWFGLPDPVELAPRAIAPYGDPDHPEDAGYEWAETVDPDNIERCTDCYASDVDLRVYEAVFGYNQETPLEPSGVPPGGTGAALDGVVDSFDLGYTPWPSAIRVTLTLHDQATTLEAGREVQFVIDLPRRGPASR